MQKTKTEKVDEKGWKWRSDESQDTAVLVQHRLAFMKAPGAI